MSYKSLVVSLAHPEAPNRLDIACRFAKAHGAQVTGILIHSTPGRAGPGAAQAPISSETRRAMEAQQQAQESEAHRSDEEARAAFQRATAQADVAGEFHSRSTGDQSVAEALLEEARCADVTLIGKPSGSAEDKRIAQTLLSESGGPVLVVPASVDYCPGAQHVGIAWNGSRGAARAVRDAMPMLEAAGRATIMMIRPNASVEASGGRLRSLLAAHGVDCEVRREHGDLRPSDALLSRAEDLGLDCVVMGAFGRARVREMITGGATTGKIMAQATTPLLMAQ